jgi:hypothetical protein
MEEEANGILYNAQRLSWFMRGGINFIDIMNMSKPQIDNINKIIEDNMETTKKSKLPFF